MFKRTSARLDLALCLAWGLFALTFRGPRHRFWDRMTATGIALASLSLGARPQLRCTRIGWREVLWGAASARLLYAVFRQADRMLRRLLPGGAAQISEIYSLSQLRPRQELMARLALIIVPGEELFWHGYGQDALSQRWGRFWGFAGAVAAYGGMHVVTGNIALIGAAVVAGAFWGALYALALPLGGLIVSHLVWDNLIFLIAPTSHPKRDAQVALQTGSQPID
jgi:membrane protease YdiL (CAAX protease family)